MRRFSSLPRVLSQADPAYRSHNFSAGPACMPLEVMRRAQAEFTNYQGTGIGMMEMSHRDKDGPFQTTMTTATNTIRKLLSVPDNYHIFFTHGGAHAQFAAVPLNLLDSSASKTVSYLDSGFWVQRAITEAAKYAKVHIAGKAADHGNRAFPPVASWNVSRDSAYFYLCANETISGLELLNDPVSPVEGIPMVGDFTSTLLSRPVKIANYGVIFASGGKNLGPAGANLVIVRSDLVKPRAAGAQPVPGILDWNESVSSKPIMGIYNTPPTFTIHMIRLMAEWTLAQGGVEAMEKRAIKRSSSVYQVVDQSNGFWSNNVDPAYRSRMNIPLRIRGGDAALEAKFVKQAESAGIHQIFGHPLFGGLRITLYNGIPDSAVDTLLGFMADFAKANR
eukprot:TRINITY_DN8519_c0_g1_i1.p1 TRINITY_DN8519_c0_g1~~TRINITY_DN8519_c0_g1_i1.p1  ORF type:complete len:419 (+),score=102.21 TRINITY_DN8519_c0_g1_i1:83-1258(+)